MGKTALVVGATGAVGREIVRGPYESQNYDKVVVWARRELKFSHEKLEVQIVFRQNQRDRAARRRRDFVRAWHDDEASRQPQAVLQSGRELPRKHRKMGHRRGHSPLRAHLRLRRGRTVEIFLHEGKGQGREKDRRAGL